MPQGTPTKVKKRKKSVLKRARQALRRAEMNRANRTRVRTMIKRLRAAISSGDTATAGNLLAATFSAIDRAIGKGVLHENTANRYKSRLTLAYNALRTAKSA
jgi:small subunit ribosomal protein S20